MMELCLIGLFLLARDDRNAFTGVGQAVIMMLAATMTFIYQLLLENAFASILKYLPASSENGGDQEEREPSLAGALGSLRHLASACCGWMIPSQEVPEDVQESIYELARNQLNADNQRGYEHADYRSPVIWIPKDPLGISEDEIAHAKDCIQDIRISNDLAELDMKGRLEITQNVADIDVI